jgi:hypothetical protein
MNMKKQVFYLLLFVCFTIKTINSEAQKNITQPRTIVASDGEVDDMDSYIRLLLYSNELNIVGMVYTSSEFHYAGDNKGTTFTSNMPFAKQYGTRTTLRWLGTEWKQGFIDKYATVYNNLAKHDKNYPSPQHLKSLVKVGNIDFESEMDHNTEGSDFIKSILLDDNPVPVYIQIWGGTNTVARALKSIEDEYKNTLQWNTVYKKVCSKLTLYIILDQDETYKKYVSANWTDIKVILNTNQFWCFAYAWTRLAPEIRSSLDGAWYTDKIKFNHGALTSSYFLWGDGQKLVNDPDHTQGDTAQVRKNGRTRFDFISEGDSPSYLNLINTGLRNLEDPSYGGWGGRFVQSKTNPRLWQDGTNVTDSNYFTKKADAQFPQSRWINAIQNDFAARADWCVKSYKEANHAPVVTLKTEKDISVKPGAVVHLSGSAKDPDSNTVTYKWWPYKEAGIYDGNIDIRNADKTDASFTVPADAKSGETIHIILEVTDNGSPQLTRYQRVIVTIQE